MAKRRKRTLFEMVRSMMPQPNLSILYWGDELLTNAYILNLVPSKSVPSTPYKQWTDKKLNLSNLQPWGLMDFVHNTSYKKR